MNDRNLRLQVVMSAIDKLTRPFKQARASTQELAASVKQSRDALNQLNQTTAKLDGFKKLQAENQKLGERLSYARQKASLMNQELGASGPPTQRQLLALEKQRLAVQRLEERQGKLQTRTAQVRAELYRAGISANDGASATARITRETERYNRQLSEQEARLRRAGEQQRKMTEARNQYSKTLEVRDRVAGAGAAMTGAGVAMGAPVVAAVKSYTSLEDAMKGVSKQVNGLRDSGGNRTAQFYEMQAAIKNASELLPMLNGAVDYAALVEGGARMGIGADAKSWEEQKKQLLDFASTSAKAATAFELPADQLAENLGKIAQLYKVPISNIEQLGDVINYLDDNAMSKGADIIDVLQRMGDTADKLDYQKAAALGSTFLSLGSAPEVAASAAKAMVRELSIASIQSDHFQEGLQTLKLDPFKLQKSMVTDSMGTIMNVLEQVNKLKPEQQAPLLTQLFGKEYGDDATKLANNLPELRRQLELTQGQAAKGSMQKESDINKDSLSAQWMLTKAGTQNVMSGLGESLRPPLMEIMRDIQPVIRSIRFWVEQNPQLTATIMKIVTALAAMAVALGTVMIGVAAVIGPLAVMRLSLQVLGIKFMPTLISAVSNLGSSIAWLARKPVALLRGAFSLLLSPLSLVRVGLMFIGSAMGVLLSPVALVIAALAGVALVIWKYWQPISAFLGGVVEGFSAAAAPIMAAFAPLQPVFGWIGDKVKALFGWFSDLLTPVKSTAAELDNAANMGKRFGQFLADGLAMVMSPLDTLKSGVSWLLEKLGIVNAQAASAKLPDVAVGSAGHPVAWGARPYGIPMFDSGGYIPRGQLGIVGENGPELVNGPANITSRRRTAALAGATALAFGSLAMPVAAKPLHPFSLPAQEYRENSQPASQNGNRTAAGTLPPVTIHIHPSPAQSPADIAREVARQLDELNRKAAARARSSFKDQGEFE
ncbi:phage tail tape measure protein [Citrobacter freundii]|uniref:phage tail tape measure protein n=1 Tax=Citrobacter freundii TaxID=546 RepID=UPI00177B633A|nr:phage tail tape measure protein [Citrobacter freundii]ELQ7794633.1 phage tail tape measure protein [Citrobacter freundii]MBE0099037.1 phage tail tape measure protein [Citrobacter freundii]MEA8857449.1 phage tail tape measure protein [Citrobacter freundii]MEB1001353.1 phage tail tape measure protein [Citrobacter freundii]